VLAGLGPYMVGVQDLPHDRARPARSRPTSFLSTYWSNGPRGPHPQLERLMLAKGSATPRRDRIHSRRILEEVDEASGLGEQSPFPDLPTCSRASRGDLSHGHNDLFWEAIRQGIG